MKIICLIPARGGSKGIPKKNLYRLDGTALIGWTLLEIIKSKHINNKDVYVATDDWEIKQYCSEYPVNIFHRPPELATDEPKIIELLNIFFNSYTCDAILLLFPTTPMVTIETLDHAIEYFEYSKLDSLFSVYKTPDFLFWNKDLLSVNYDYRNRGKRQDRGPTYLETGSFYLMKRQAFLQDQNQICGKFEVIGVPMTEAFELDSLDQLPFFEALLRHKDDIRNGTLWTK